MKNNKNCQITSCGWGYRHELLGLILLIIASVLTVFTTKGLSVAAMFLVGLVLYCHKFLGCHCCYSETHDHSEDGTCDMATKPMGKVSKVKKAMVKKAMVKKVKV